MTGKKVVIGSSHFVFEDEGCKVRPEYWERFEALPEEYSHLYLAIDDSGDLYRRSAYRKRS